VVANGYAENGEDIIPREQLEAESWATWRDNIPPAFKRVELDVKN
jgi:hypothetical protein